MRLIHSLFTALLVLNLGSAGSIAQERYETFRTQLLSGTQGVEVFGIALHEETATDTQKIRVAVAQDDGSFICSDRIWHLPKTYIVTSSDVADAYCSDAQIARYVMAHDTVVVEESYRSLRLSGELPAAVLDEDDIGKELEQALALRGFSIGGQFEPPVFGFLCEIVRAACKANCANLYSDPVKIAACKKRCGRKRCSSDVIAP